MNYSKKPTRLFLKKLLKFSKTNKELYEEIIKSLDIITNDPYNKSNRQLKSKNAQNVKDTELKIIE